MTDAPVDNSGKAFLNGEHQALDVGTVDPVEVLLGHLGQRRKLIGPGVGEEYVDLALFMLHGLVQPVAPLTRSRAQQPGDIPGELMLEYYRQRASDGGLP